MGVPRPTRQRDGGHLSPQGRGSVSPDRQSEPDQVRQLLLAAKAIMIETPDDLVGEFASALDDPALAIRHEGQPAPHQPHGLPMGFGAVYVFSLSSRYGAGCPAGPNRVLKVGRVG